MTFLQSKSPRNAKKEAASNGTGMLKEFDKTEKAVAMDELPTESSLQLEASPQAMAALTSALHDLQADFRNKTAECEALQDTVNSLSAILKSLDEELTERKMTVERLHLKLAAVTFVERGDARWMEDQEDEDLESEVAPDGKGSRGKNSSFGASARNRAAAKKNQKKAPSRSGGSRKKSSSRSHIVEDPVVREHLERFEDAQYSSDSGSPVSEDSDTDTTASNSTSSDDGGEVKESTSLEGENSSKEADSDSVGLTSMTTPGQAAFYQVIFERDLAQKKAKNLAKELHNSRTENQNLKKRLNKSTALVELAYAGSYEDTSTQQRRHSTSAAQHALVQNKAMSSSALHTNTANNKHSMMSTLLRGAVTHQMAAQKALEAAPVPAPESSQQARSKDDLDLRQYLDSMAADAADKAAGFENARVEM